MVFNLKNIAWLPPEVIADRKTRPSASSRVTLRLTRLLPSML